MSRFAIYFLAGAILAACALPVEEPRSSFAPDRELIGLSLGRDAANLFARGRYADAELKFRQALYLFPQAINVKRNLAMTLAKSGQFDEALEIYQNLLKTAPDSAEIIIELAGLYYDAAQFDKAAEYYLSIHTLLTNDKSRDLARISRSMAVLYFRRGDEEQALCYSDLARQLSPGVDELLRHARILSAIGLHSSARSMLDELVKNKQGISDPGVLYALALSSFGLSQYQDVLKYSDLARDLGAANLGLDATLGLMQFFAQRAIAPTSDRMDSERLRSFLSEDMLDNSASIYLPVNLLRAIAAAIAEQQQSA